MRLRKRKSESAAEDRAHRELSLRADVPDVGAVPRREPDGAEHQGRGLQEQLADAVARRDRLHEEDVERLARIDAERREERAADDHRRGRGKDGRRVGGEP